MLIVCILLGVALAAVLVRLFQFKCDLRRMAERLSEIAGADTNAQLNVETHDKDVNTLALAVNQALECKRKSLLETVRRENNLKCALTNISHDLRTPLTSALGYLQMLESGSADAETQMRYLEIVRGRLDVLVVLLNRLFEFTQAVEGQTPMTLEKLNVAGILRESLAAFYPELCENGFTVDADIPEPPIYTLADKDALVRVLQNILGNIVVHGEGYVTVRLMPDGEIVIGNKVRGIEEIDAARMFERFYTADASRTGKRTGLGLAISKELVEKMNGQIISEVLDDLLVLKIRLPSQ